MQIFARKRANALQILFDFGATRMQNSTGVRYATLMRSCRSPLNHCFVWHRDCTTAAFEIVQIFARKRANALQILLDFGATQMQNSAGMRRERCATCTTSAQVSARSLICLASRLHDCSVRNRANSREKTRERAANFVHFGATRMQNSSDFVTNTRPTCVA